MAGAVNSGSFRNNIHILPIRVYYEDTDFSGIVYHANYLKFMERGRSDCLRLMGIHHKDLIATENPIAWTIVRMEIGFHKPAVIDDMLEVSTAYTNMTAARLYAEQTVRREGEDLVRAQIEAACISSSGRPVRIPKYARDIIGSYLTSLEHK